MKHEFHILRNELANSSINNYFIKFESIISQSKSIEWLTKLLTDLPYKETKPYLFNRTLTPVDNRFEQIELVYNVKEELRAIRWKFEVKLSQLIDYFGDAIINFEPYSNSTAFIFKDRVKEVEIIKTRLPQNLIRIDKLKFTIGGTVTTLDDPEFEFIQWNLKKSDNT